MTSVSEDLPGISKKTIFRKNMMIICVIYSFCHLLRSWRQIFLHPLIVQEKHLLDVLWIQLVIIVHTTISSVRLEEDEEDSVFKMLPHKQHLRILFFIIFIFEQSKQFILYSSEVLWRSYRIWDGFEFLHPPSHPGVSNKVQRSFIPLWKCEKFWIRVLWIWDFEWYSDQVTD